jgi:hypothetical protein
MLCCTNKPSNIKKGLYHPLPIPSRPWEIISMDFVGGFPINKKGHKYLFVVVERFIKMCIIIPCTNTIKTQEVAKIFFEQV